MQGWIVIARNPHPVIKPVELPSELMQTIQDMRHWVREGAVRELEQILNGTHKGLALSAQEALKGMIHDDSERVRKEVARVMGPFAETQPVKEPEQEEPRVDEKDITSTPVVKTGPTQNEEKLERSLTTISTSITGQEKPIIEEMDSTGKSILLWLLPAILVPIISGIAVYIIFFFSSQSIKFRSVPKKIFSEALVESMLKKKGFYDSLYNENASGFANDFEVRHDGKVVYDHASGLMWQQSGSKEDMPYDKAKGYIRQLNQGEGFAGYRDWRLPTLEEAMSLMEPTEMNGDLHIDPLFDSKQQWIWTSDTKEEVQRQWFVSFSGSCCTFGSKMRNIEDIRDIVNGTEKFYVRAVR